MYLRLALLIVLTFVAYPQSPTFDVASVKPSPSVPLGQNIDINLGMARRGEVVLANTTLSECIRFAYGLVSQDQVAGPDWINDRETRFDILAKAADDTPHDQLLLMLRSLLDERFKLQFHHEPRRIPHYTLVIAKNGPKLNPATLDAARQSYAKGRIYHSNTGMPTLAMLLSRQLRQTVLDMTGLTGTYDVQLEWAPDLTQPPETKEAEERAAGPSIFTALQEQLGLKLEARKDPLDVLVIDRAERAPLPN